MSEAERAARYSDLFGSAGGGEADSFGDRRAHQHASDCAYCPFCATVAVVRRTHPEVMEHLAAAARELIAAAGVLVEEASRAVAPAPEAGGETKPGDEGQPANVRRIDAV